MTEAQVIVEMDNSLHAGIFLSELSAPVQLRSKLYVTAEDEAPAPDKRASYGGLEWKSAAYMGESTSPAKGVSCVKISILPHKRLKVPLEAVIEPDGERFIARGVDLPLYGLGDDAKEALEALKREIESLWNDLIQDDNFSAEFLFYKRFLKDIVVD